MGVRDVLRREAGSPLRRSLQAQQGIRDVLRKSARKTHHIEQWDYWDEDDPGEATDAYDNAQAIVDQEAVAGRAHRPGYHGHGYRTPVEKSGIAEGGRPPAGRRLPPGAHRTPPKGYPTDRSQYAIPEWYALPLDTAKHAANAASRFPQMRAYTKLSPAAKRRIWRRIVAAERRFGIEPGPEVLAAAGLKPRPKA